MRGVRKARHPGSRGAKKAHHKGARHHATKGRHRGTHTAAGLASESAHHKLPSHAHHAAANH